MKWIQLAITCLTALALLVYICVKNGTVNIGGIVDRAAREAAYGGAEFVIHDKSSQTVCNRLITVRPFDWMIWACRGELYILNPEGGGRCAAGQTPAVRVYADQFVETCLTLAYDTIVAAYSKANGARIKRVPYEIEGSTFTVLSALNLLAKEWLTFDTGAATVSARLRDVGCEGCRTTTTTAAVTPNEVARRVGWRPPLKNYLTTPELAGVMKHLARREAGGDRSPRLVR